METLTITKSQIILRVESLLYKYGKAIEGKENFKLVYNTQSSTAGSTLDAQVINDSYKTRLEEAITLIEEFVQRPVTESSSGVTTINFNRDRWIGATPTLKAAFEKYIADGMMVDWLAVTSPSEAPMYSTQLVGDALAVKEIIYKKGAPQ